MWLSCTGTFNGQTVASLGLNKAVRIVLAAMYSIGEVQAAELTFAGLAAALSSACKSSVGASLKNLATGDALNDRITDDDCAQVAAAIAAVEMGQVSRHCSTTPHSGATTVGTTSGVTDAPTASSSEAPRCACWGCVLMQSMLMGMAYVL